MLQLQLQLQLQLRLRLQLQLQLRLEFDAAVSLWNGYTAGWPFDLALWTRCGQHQTIWH